MVDGFSMNVGTMISIVDFWIHVSVEYQELADTAHMTLLPFTSSYVCEAGSSTMSITKTNYWNSMDVHASLRLAVSSVES